MVRFHRNALPNLKNAMGIHDLAVATSTKNCCDRQIYAKRIVSSRHALSIEPKSMAIKFKKILLRRPAA